ncbi:MAG: RDD family protein [bacterium]|nr:RDD family protein [bacterium]
MKSAPRGSNSARDASGEGRYLDTDFEIPAPEYILFRYSLAGPITRMIAVFIDHLVILGLILLSFLVLAILGNISAFAELEAVSGLMTFLLFMAMFLLTYFYFLLFEWGNRGRTPGKMALGLRVVSVDGTSLDLLQILVRNLVRPADMFPMSMVLFPTYLVGGLGAFVTGQSFRRLGDLAAGTVVVREQRPQLNMDFAGSGAERIAHLSREMHMRIYPSPALTQGLNDFAAGHARLNPARALEIAQGVEERVRKFFGAESLDCTPVELLLAAHHYLYSMSHDELIGFAPLTSGLKASENQSQSIGGRSF